MPLYGGDSICPLGSTPYSSLLCSIPWKVDCPGPQLLCPLAFWWIQPVKGTIRRGKVRAEWHGDTHPPSLSQSPLPPWWVGSAPLMEGHGSFDSLFPQLRGSMTRTPFVHRGLRGMMTPLPERHSQRHHPYRFPLACAFLCKSPFIKFSLITCFHSWYLLPAEHLRDMPSFPNFALGELGDPTKDCHCHHAPPAMVGDPIQLAGTTSHTFQSFRFASSPRRNIIKNFWKSADPLNFSFIHNNTYVYADSVLAPWDKVWIRQARSLIT